MKVNLESTSKIVELVVGGVAVPARVWEGKTASGIPMHALVVRVAVHEGLDDTEFKRELKECAAPSAEIRAYPLRMIL